VVSAIAAAVMLLAAWSGCAVNPAFTPGATNPAVTQATIGATICRPGYTKTVRNVSTHVKHEAPDRGASVLVGGREA
jgi:hypothetical protein